MLLMQQFLASRSSVDVMAAYGNYWQKALAEYGKEYTTLNELLAGVSNELISHAASAHEEAAKTASSSRAAA
jgi:hypothetical protein